MIQTGRCSSPCRFWTSHPTTMAVLSAELYAGEGIQDTEEYQLAKNDQQLYHLLPTLHRLLPALVR